MEWKTAAANSSNASGRYGHSAFELSNKYGNNDRTL